MLTGLIEPYLYEIKFYENVELIKQNTKTYESFALRYFKFWDGLKVLKLIHHLRDEYIPNIEIEKAFEKLYPNAKCLNNEEILLYLRKCQKEYKHFPKVI